MKAAKLLQTFSKRAIGDAKERLAEEFLSRQGARVLERNLHGPMGEIDLILEHENCLIFVETRYRKNRSFGGAAASVSATKRKKIIATAQYYLQSNPHRQHSPCRFDVIAIEGDEINWIKNAFQLSD